MNIGVITADIVSSRHKKNTAHWLAALKETLHQFGPSPKTWEIFRGDSFQLAIYDIRELFYSAVKIKAEMKEKTNLSIRMGLGIGDSNVLSHRILESNGQAFINSGTCYNQLAKKTLQIKSQEIKLDEELNLYFDLISLQIDRWTLNSAQAIRIMLENPDFTQNEIAFQLNITQGRVSERLKRSSMEHILQVDDRYRKLIEQTYF